MIGLFGTDRTITAPLIKLSKHLIISDIARLLIPSKTDNMNYDKI